MSALIESVLIVAGTRNDAMRQTATSGQCFSVAAHFTFAFSRQSQSVWMLLLTKQLFAGSLF